MMNLNTDYHITGISISPLKAPQNQPSIIILRHFSHFSLMYQPLQLVLILLNWDDDSAQVDINSSDAQKELSVVPKLRGVPLQVSYEILK
jgi:hypothetical protein